jgi:NAD(P)-dependent dehydrogenase (short-subunit alcohol dehydrogenase family)
MSDRIVIVTGAKGGLGSFVTRRFLENADVVIGASRSIEQSDFPGEHFSAVRTDFSDATSVQSLVDGVIKLHGRIDIVAHVVGGFVGGTPLHSTDENTWTLMLRQNLDAAFHVIHAALPHMRRAQRGRLIAVGSKAAEQPVSHLGAYVVSKAALVTLVKTVALENSDLGITANLVLPGTMDTPVNRAAMPKADFSKWVSPGAVADAIFWLASDAAVHVSGAAIPVSGNG